MLLNVFLELQFVYIFLYIFYFSGSSQVSTGAIAGGVIAAVVVIFLCIGGAVFAIVYIKRRKKSSGKVEITRYLIRSLILKLTLNVNMSTQFDCKIS